MLNVRAIVAASFLGLAAQGVIGQTPPAPTPTTHPAPQPLATVDEIQQQMDAGDFKDALLALKRILARNDVAALGYDRHRLLQMRADCELALKDKQAALGTWTLIQSEADRSAAIDNKAEAMAMCAMLRKSNGLFYAPKTAADKTPIDIVSPANRPKAFEALFEDDSAVFKQKFVNSKAQTSLTPLKQIAADFGCVQAEERLATGKNVETRKFADTAATWAANLIRTTVVSWHDDLVRIDRRASEIVVVTVINDRGRHVNRRQRRGLGDDDVTRLKSIQDQAQQVPGVIEMLNLAFVHPAALKNVSDLSGQALQVRDGAEKLLDGGHGVGGDDTAGGTDDGDGTAADTGGGATGNGSPRRRNRG